jgi:hypothetical protein
MTSPAAPSPVTGRAGVRPTVEQVLLLAPDRAAAAAAPEAADPARWSAAGSDDRAVWGQYLAGAAEPYDVVVDLTGPAFRCSCPSRKVPCKHALGLLLLVAQDLVPPARRLRFADEWLLRRERHPASPPADAADDPLADDPLVADPSAADDVATPAVAGEVRVDPAGRGTESIAVAADDVGSSLGPCADTATRERRRGERAERMRAGLRDLDRWVADCVRRGLADPELARPETWELVAARLVDAQCGSLANRVRRIATRVGQHARWHDDVLEELAVLHVLAQGALRTGDLERGGAAGALDLVDGVHVATGLTVAKDDVLAGVPSTTVWHVVGESRTREDRITVHRTWLGAIPDEGPITWAMLLAFGTVAQEVRSEHVVGTSLHADLHWYPGATPMRALVGAHHDEPRAAGVPRAGTLAEAFDAVGDTLAREPWMERVPMLAAVVPRPLGDGRWVLADHTGAATIAPEFWRRAELVSVSGGRPVVVMAEWTADGVLPLTVWSDGVAVSL